MTENNLRKNAARAAGIFYLLIAFEIVYMITPFGVYYYSVYGTGLGFLNNSPVTSWLTGFFLPHYAATTASALTLLKDIGWVLAVGGFSAFCVGAGQIYYSKVVKRRAVTGGVYRLIRHPQYASLSVCSFGLLLVWPRYIVLIMFITMLFAYYFLAKAEEKECEAKFGKPYEDYKKGTSMFVPFSVPAGALPRLPASGTRRYAALLFLYIIVIASSIGLANALKNYSIRHLYTAYSDRSATISLVRIDKDRLERILGIALKDGEVKRRLVNAGTAETERFLNYVLPAEWFFPDIPMNDVKKIGEHYSPEEYDPDRYKILFMVPQLKPGVGPAGGNELISNTVKRRPVAEVEVSLTQNRVTAIENPPPTVVWGDIPTPLF